jgi:hypothetical protein
MCPHSSDTLAVQIAVEVAKGMRTLPCGLRDWVEAHLVVPRPIVLSRDPDGQREETFWLVTDHVGVDDAPCRIVFNREELAFGLAMTLENGRECFIGQVASFADAVQNM